MAKAEPGRAGSVVRAVLACLALPGVVAFTLPLAIAAGSGSWMLRQPWGLLLVLAGTALLIACAVEFHRAGGGTLAPWWAPRRLVTTGPFRFSRHPMYLAVPAILAGWAITFASGQLAFYLAVVAAAMVVRSFVEDQQLAERFGDEYDAYAARVRRWL